MEKISKVWKTDEYTNISTLPLLQQIKLVIKRLSRDNTSKIRAYNAFIEEQNKNRSIVLSFMKDLTLIMERDNKHTADVTFDNVYKEAIQWVFTNDPYISLYYSYKEIVNTSVAHRGSYNIRIIRKEKKVNEEKKETT